MSSALPSVQLTIDGAKRNVLVDSGCTCSIIYAPLCNSWTRKPVSIVTVGGSRRTCLGVGRICICTRDGVNIYVDALVVDFMPLGYSCILGMNAISAMGGVSISSPRSVHFGVDAGNVCSAALGVSREDFDVTFDGETKSWTVKWNWSGGREPKMLENVIEEYSIPSDVRERYDAVLQNWIAEGWLQPYDEEKLGPAKGLIPLLAVVQVNKTKVRPVMDFRELNSHVEALSADADVCSQKLREWRRCGVNTSILDLKDAYMQIRVHENLWPFQTVIVRGRRYCLTRLGFGINVAPAVMKAVLTTVLGEDVDVQRAASPYVDDIYIDNSVVSTDRVREHLLKFGLRCKPAERVTDGARVLGLWVCGDDDKLVWKRCNEIPDLPDKLTRRSVFSLCGKLLSHSPVNGWLRPAVAFLKRRVNSISSSWDKEVDDGVLRRLVTDVVRRVKASDPARGRWDVSGDEAAIWVDASSLAVGVALVVDNQVIEDASWLRSNAEAHINRAELDAVIKGVNMALVWNMRRLHLKTDSQTAYHWVSDALSGKARLRTKAASEMLIRRRLSIICSLVKEYDLSLSVALVPSAANLADPLTRVPCEWLKLCKESVEPSFPCGAAESPSVDDRVKAIHHTTGHQGVKRSLYFARRADPAIKESQIREAIAECQRCCSIDPAPVKWAKGNLDVDGVWVRVGMDITHYRGLHYLSLIDHGSSRFTVWRLLRRQDSASVIQQLENVFCERGAPSEVLTDNDTAFRSSAFQEFARRWGIKVRYRCAYAPSGNGIVERCHRTVKRIAARKGCSLQEAVYWYNLAPQDDVSASTAPANQVYRYEVRVSGVDSLAADVSGESVVGCPFSVGDVVWVKPFGARCTTQFGVGRVTGIVSDCAVEVDGIPRHVRDLRLKSQSEAGDDAVDVLTDIPGCDDELLFLSSENSSGSPQICEDAAEATGIEESESDQRPLALRRTPRNVGPPDRYGVVVDSSVY